MTNGLDNDSCPWIRLTPESNYMTQMGLKNDCTIFLLFFILTETIIQGNFSKALTCFSNHGKDHPFKITHHTCVSMICPRRADKTPASANSTCRGVHVQEHSSYIISVVSCISISKTGLVLISILNSMPSSGRELKVYAPPPKKIK